MITLHTGYLDGKLFLWAETESEVNPLSSSQSEIKKALKPQTLVRTLSGEALIELLLSLDLFPGDDILPTVEPRAVWLPMLRGKPLLTVFGQALKANGKPTLKPWLAEGLLMDPLQSTIFFSRLPNLQQQQKLIAPGILLADDVRFSWALFRLSAAWVAEEQFLPDLEVNQDGLNAVWQPPIYGSSEVSVKKLAACMPGSFRAITLVS